MIPRPSMFAPSVARPQVDGHHANAADQRMSDNTPAPSLIPCPVWQVFSYAYGWRATAEHQSAAAPETGSVYRFSMALQISRRLARGVRRSAADSTARTCSARSPSLMLSAIQRE